MSQKENLIIQLKYENSWNVLCHILQIKFRDAKSLNLYIGNDSVRLVEKGLKNQNFVEVRGNGGIHAPFFFLI